ncbi:MAG: beta-ketoacyl synthase chain length factor [Rhodocyclaceae bacterium]|nr:beta-ketoacyl synthase chain length factor [Rhodocyclaceae bacterium]
MAQAAQGGAAAAVGRRRPGLAHRSPRDAHHHGTDRRIDGTLRHRAWRPAGRPAAPVLNPPSACRPGRRASRLVKAALGVGLEAVTQAGADAAQLATVFTSSSGDGHNCHALCEMLASDDRAVSPTRFHNSVHNAAAGYWGIATGAMAPSQVLCAFDASFAAGLLEALAQVATTNAAILLVSYDAEYPEPIFAKRPVPDAAGVALLLAPRRSDKSLAEMKVSLGETPNTPMSDAALESLRTGIPAMRALPLLARLARRQAGTVSLEYLAPLSLRVAVAPC